MQVIPVLDIMGGVVVHARGGDRAGYRPIETPLAPGTSEPVAIVGGYLSVFPFDTVYVADLDGIAGRESDHATLRALGFAFPGMTFWVDDGSATVEGAARLARLANVRPVVGTEALRSVETLRAIRDAVPEAILSLDQRGRTFLGPEALLHSPDCWPGTVIAMTLAAVGSDAGPDIVKVRRLKADKPDAAIFAAGGVRGPADLRALASAGAAGALVATALHSGKIKAGDLARIAGLD